MREIVSINLDILNMKKLESFDYIVLDSILYLGAPALVIAKDGVKCFIILFHFDS